MDRSKLATYISPKISVKYEVFFDHTDPQCKGAGGIIREGVGYAGFWAEEGRITDYDGVWSLNRSSLEALRKAGFDTTEVED